MKIKYIKTNQSSKSIKQIEVHIKKVKLKKKKKNI